MPLGHGKHRWRKQTATTHPQAQKPQRGISIPRGAKMPPPSGRDVTPLLPDAARAFLAALERAHAHVAEWLPTIEDASASQADHTRASLAIMIEANSLTDDIKDLAEATRADAVAEGKERRAKAVGNIRQLLAPNAR